MQSRVAIGCWMLVLLLTVMESAIAQRPTVGTVERAQGRCVAMFGESSRRLQEGDEVRQHDVLITSAGARLQIVLTDGTRVSLAEEAELLVDEFVFEPESNQGDLGLRALLGAFEFSGGAVEDIPEPSVEVMTPVAMLGVRGTAFWAGPIDDGYGVLVLDGAVEVANRGGRVTLGPGEGTMLYSRDRAPTPVKPWGQAKIDRALAMTRF
jgi:hypothetical protein